MSRASEWARVFNENRPNDLAVPFRNDDILTWSVGSGGELYIQTDDRTHAKSPFLAVFVMLKPQEVAAVLKWLTENFGERS